ncbi:MAG TPA: gamma-glutamyl-gamma-aminobutyrate hydrolase family protein [Thermodesulfobacteriota bacterium]|nr:gamma-glutamyl-gamma-aminobutyrate hydrolase family protein [Thermodesulfobacteriota bacterium]
MKVLVLRHVPHEHLGTLAEALRANNITYEYINWYENKNPSISIDNLHGLIILGGPMNVYETDRYPYLEMEDRLIKQAIEKDVPILGICLGAQLVAKALGSRVIKNKEKEIGWYPLKITEEGSKDRLFMHFNNEEIVFQWHGDTFEIPESAVHLAESTLCTNQAFRHGSNVYGLQFHIEVTPEMISEWLNVPENQKEIMSLEGNINPESIKAEIPKFRGRLNLLAGNVFQEFCGLIRKQNSNHPLDR